MNDHDLVNVFVLGVIFGFVSFVLYVAVKSRIDDREDIRMRESELDKKAYEAIPSS